MNAEGGEQQKMARGCVSTFSPDGSHILYGFFCDKPGDIWLMNADGSNPQQLISSGDSKNATWSPDGKKIVFQQSNSGQEGPFAQFIMTLDDPAWFKLTDYDINGRSPVWQP